MMFSLNREFYGTPTLRPGHHALGVRATSLGVRSICHFDQDTENRMSIILSMVLESLFEQFNLVIHTHIA